MLNMTVYTKYVKAAVICDSEVWCLRKKEIGMLWTEISTVRVMCVPYSSKIGVKDLMQKLGLNEATGYGKQCVSWA